MIKSEYLSGALSLDKIDTIIKDAIKELKPLLAKIIADGGVPGIVFKGHSGALIAPIVAYELKVPVLFIRKSIRNCHSSMYVEGDYSCTHYIIIDDLIDSGKTINSVIQKMKSQIPNAKFLGVWLYVETLDTWETAYPKFKQYILNKKPRSSCKAY